MGFISEFKKFAVKGNVVDLAVGVIIGGAFGKIVASLVDDIIMPPIGYLTGGIDFASKKIIIKAADEAAKTPEVAIRYGNFINVAIQFFIIAFCVFLIVKAINAMKEKEEAKPAAPAGPTPTEKLLMEIRDELKKP